MPPETCHRSLVKLPPEVRLMILKRAFHPPTDWAAHFFTVFNPSNSEEATIMSPYSLSLSTNQPSAIGAPVHVVDGVKTPSWYHASNLSTYSIDSGLWTASKASLYVMEKYYLIEHQRESRRLAASLIGDAKKKYLYKFLRMGIALSPGSIQYLRVDPMEDLVCFRPFGFSTMAWNELPADTRTVQPFCDGKVKRMAIEFDPGWTTPCKPDPEPSSLTKTPMTRMVDAQCKGLFFDCEALFIIVYGLQISSSSLALTDVVPG